MSPACPEGHRGSRGPRRASRSSCRMLACSDVRWRDVVQGQAFEVEEPFFVGHQGTRSERARGPRAVRSAIFGSKTGFRPLILPKEPARFGAVLAIKVP